MRCDINISMKNDQIQGERVEIKNVLGLKFVEKAIEFELARQAEALDQGD